MMHKLFCIYETENLINNKIYVGCKVDPQSSYLGSGKALHHAINKYGKGNFNRKILMTFPNAKEMLEAERFIVDRDFVLRKDTYNIAIGGNGGAIGERHPFYGKKRSKETRQKISETLTGVSWGSHSEESKKKMSDSKRKYYEEHPEEAKKCFQNAKVRKGKDHHMYGKKHSEETRQKMSEAARNRGKR